MRNVSRNSVTTNTKHLRKELITLEDAKAMREKLLAAKDAMDKLVVASARHCAYFSNDYIVCYDRIKSDIKVIEAIIKEEEAELQRWVDVIDSIDKEEKK